MPERITFDGMSLFRDWGPHIRRFAIAFEVNHSTLKTLSLLGPYLADTDDSDQLAKLPTKGKFEDLKTWWGNYRWPHPNYTRYQKISRLEKEADEVLAMRSAFSNLQKANELAICIDSGLGWLEGPDISDHARLFKRKSEVFGLTLADQKYEERKSQQAWRRFLQFLNIEEIIKTDVQSAPVFRHRHPQGQLYIPPTPPRPHTFDGQNLSDKYPKSQLIPANFRNLSQGNDSSPYISSPVTPSKLTTSQKEWLLENQWAQTAFLTSYCLALSDNSKTFQYVNTLNIAQLSSRLLLVLHRSDIWGALPNLKHLTIKIKADFREVEKRSSGLVEAVEIRRPSKAAEPLHDLLRTFVAGMEKVRTLTFGYVGGGEHQTGLFGRNRFILPAPLVDYSLPDIYTQGYEDVLYLPHVKHLTIVNCWVAPPILKTLVHKMCGAKLRSLTLDSVSLTAHSGVTNPDIPNAFADEPRQFGRGVRRDAMFSKRLESFYRVRRPELDPDPFRVNESWLDSPGRVGSWPDIIDAITPGPTLDYARYAFQVLPQPPKIINRGKLRVVNLKSCGYVRLVNQHSMDQSRLPNIYAWLDRALQERALDLMPVMMHRNEDELLGQIAPDYISDEKNVLECGFQMMLGWGSNDKKYDNLEDGQPEGGWGRFSGSLHSWKSLMKAVDSEELLSD